MEEALGRYVCRTSSRSGDEDININTTTIITMVGSELSEKVGNS